MADAPTAFDYVTKLALPSLTFIIAVSGAIYTARQYERTKRVRAVDLAISLTGQLDTVPELAFACQALDWGVGPLIVPERYRPLLERRGADGAEPKTPTEKGVVVEHRVELMALALRPVLSFDREMQPLGLVYRYCFDKLFQHLSNVDRLVESGQVDVGDLGPLTYWLKRIACYEYPPGRVTGEEVFQPFVKDDDFDYGGVIRLGKRLGVKNWDYAAPAPSYGIYSTPASSPPD